MTTGGQKNALLKDSSVYIIAEFLSKGVPFLLLPYLTRKLGTDGYGELSYYLSIIAFLLIFVGLMQQGAITRYYYFYGKNALNLIITTGMLYSFLIFLLGASASLIFQSEVLLYCFFAAFFQSLHTTQLSIRQCQKQARGYAVLQISTAVFNLALTILIFELTHDELVKNRIIVMIVVYASVSAVAYVSCFQQINMRFKFSLRQYKLAFSYILGLGVPLIFHALSYTIKGQLDKVLIYNTFSKEDLGVYSAGVQLASVLTVFTMAVNTATLPYFYQYLKEKKIDADEVKRFFWRSLMVVPIPMLIFYLTPDKALSLLLGNGFEKSGYYVMFFLFSFSLVIPYFFLGNYLFYYGANKQIAFCSAISTVVYAVMLFLFRKNIELLPGASLVANALILPLLYYFVSKDVKLLR